jgi:DNA-binding MarR family transcriptional regulator
MVVNSGDRYMDIPPQEREALELLIGFASVGRILTAAIDRMVEFDVSDNQSLVVLSVMAIDGPIRPVQIAELTGLTSGGATKLVTRLETNGLVRRSYGEDPADLRSTRVSLTDEGEELAALIAQEFQLQMGQVGPLLKRFSRLAGNT